MKSLHSKLLILFLVMTLKSYGQETISQVLADKVLATDKIAWIYDLDVFRYYYKELNVGDTYNTPLQRQVYMKSEDYRKKLNELEKLKSELVNKLFYLKLSNVEEFSSYSDRYGNYRNNVDKFIISDYNIETKGFEFELWTNYRFNYEDEQIKGTAIYSREIQLGVKSFPLMLRGAGLDDFKYDENKIYTNSSFIFVLLKGLSVLKRVPMVNGEPAPKEESWVPNEFLFIPVDENSALEIEKYKKDIELYLFFTPVNKETINSSHGWNKTYNDIIITTSDETRLIIANKKTGKIYFDKTYQ